MGYAVVVSVTVVTTPKLIAVHPPTAIVRGLFGVCVLVFVGVGRESGDRVAWRRALHTCARAFQAPISNATAVPAPPQTFRDHLIALVAATHLTTRFPMMSAATLPRACWAWLGPAVLIVGCFGFFVWSQPLALAAVFSVAFACLIILRLAAIMMVLIPQDEACVRRDVGAVDAPLPMYSVLVPLYDEANIAARSVAALSSLDYPADLLEVLYLTEADDDATRAALLGAGLAPFMAIMTVPNGQPRTKPRALNAGLQLARGSFVAVFDAEDIPDRQQLKTCVAAFRGHESAGVRVSCLQARLEIENQHDTFWTRMFALEYAALFGAILPALHRLGLPLPLGGTSNHFRRDDLVAAGGWDAFNVTEDADLGYRLARLGYRIALVDAGTDEEAPVTSRIWFDQRTRWLKGWMQTLFVHARSPRALIADLGWWQSIGFFVTFGGMVLSALVHPWALVWISMSPPGFSDKPSSMLQLISAFNLVVGYGSGIALSALVAWKRGAHALMMSALLIPIYWLMISAAAYNAIYEYVRRPYHWQKTPHGLAKASALPPSMVAS